MTENRNNFVAQYNARAGARDGVCREPLTSKDPVFSLLSSKYSPLSSYAVSREALPPYISLIKSKERRDHTHPILSAGFSVCFARLSSFLPLPSFLSATLNWASICSTSYNTTRPLNRSCSPYVWQIICDRDKDRRGYSFSMLAKRIWDTLRLNLDREVIDD